jgi:hypothetical protein
MLGICKLRFINFDVSMGLMGRWIGLRIVRFKTICSCWANYIRFWGRIRLRGIKMGVRLGIKAILNQYSINLNRQI